MKKSFINPMPAFFDRYINLVENIHIFEAFEKYSPDKVYHEMEKLSQLKDQVYAPGKWTIKDIIQHVTDNERIMAYRALRFSRNDKTALPGYDEELLGANTNAANRTLQDLMTEFTVLRASTIALYQGMSQEMMLRSGVAYKSEISALALGFVIIGHPIHHMNVIQERYFPLI
ncbi:DinB family protein [Dyadobacter psychrotolerans]|uniref:DinB family protein n=1 Tax=Dyadobacter psychrotolerans TaxID=2541721 RepID=A0A4R5DSL5_9BACT|nr:DinB family protein [Dyadobacter psychrotolerans]TDE15344.1 DinB family protein [Dyadobacter psychrotolerans]